MRLPIRLNRRVNRRGAPALALGLGAVALLAAACGGAAASSTTNPPSSNSSSSGQTSRPLPGASGEVAALTPPSMEVQNPESGQTTVSWTSSTTFTQTVSASLSDVTAGDCVSVSGTPSSPGSSSSPISARTVSIMPASSSGTCTNPASVFGSNGSGSSGFHFSGTPGSFPGGGSFPTRTTTPGETFPQTSTAFGQVTSVSSSGFVVSGTEFSARFRPASSGSTTTTTTPPKADITVTTTSSTTVSRTESASASNLSVGECVTAAGSSSSNGAVTADSISIRQPVNGECFGGFGGGGFGGGGFGGFGGGSGANND